MPSADMPRESQLDLALWMDLSGLPVKELKTIYLFMSRESLKSLSPAWQSTCPWTSENLRMAMASLVFNYTEQKQIQNKALRVQWKAPLSSRIVGSSFMILCSLPDITMS